MAARFAWLLAGALLVFGFLAGFSIGLPFLLLGVVLCAVLAWRRVRVDGGAMLAGAGCVLVALGFLNLGLALGTVLLVLGVAALVAGRLVCHRSPA